MPPIAVRRLRTSAVLLTFAVVFVWMRVAGYVGKSATWDEPMHLTSGYAALRGDYRFDPAHPPLARMWAALPLLFMDVKFDAAVIDKTAPEQWLLGPDAYAFAREFLYRQNDADRLLNAGRFMMVLFGVMTGWVLFFWVDQWLGFRTAVCALIAYLLSPNLTAHASLVTTDMPETCLLFTTTYFLWRLCRRYSVLNLAGVAGFGGLAIVTKFSGLILGPIIGVVMVVAVWRARLTWRQAGATVLCLAAWTLYAIWAVYGFHAAPAAANPAWLFQSGPHAGNYFLRPFVDWLDARHLLPNAFSQGLLYCATVSAQSSYLLGSYSVTGWWYYFPVAIAVKTPVSMLMLVAAGLIVCVRERRSLGAFDLWLIGWSVAAYFAIALLSGVNIGIRHVLPVYPFLLLVVAVAVDRMLASTHLYGRVALATAGAFWVWSYLSVYPNSLTFFNRLAGGPDRGLSYLSDSNLDWGQHLKLLKKWMDEAGVAHINLAYFGQADPAYYQINASLLPGTSSGNVGRPQLPGYVAISATILSGVYLPPAGRLNYAPFRQLTPVARIGDSIYVYWIDQWPEAAETAVPARTERELADYLLSIGWRKRAIFHYRRYLRSSPGDAEALSNLGVTLLGLGDAPEALKTLRRAVDQAPYDGRMHRVLGAALLDVGRIEEARRHVLVAVSTRPQDALSRYLFGRLLLADGRTGEAVAEFEQAIRLDPALEDARTYLARARTMKGGQPAIFRGGRVPNQS